MAPAAKVAAYKVCWTGSVEREISDGCADSDSVAAIDQAVLDGVDVINYSIGGTSESTVVDPVEMAFMFAAAAGVYNAASAGNSGPGESTLDHPSPWVSTTAAGTHRIAEKKLSWERPGVHRCVHDERAAEPDPHGDGGGLRQGRRRTSRGRALWGGDPRPGEGVGQAGRLPARCGGPDREVLRGPGGRRRRHGADQPVAELPQRRPARRIPASISRTRRWPRSPTTSTVRRRSARS